MKSGNNDKKMLKEQFDQFPYASKISFAPLIRFWEQNLQSDKIGGYLGQEIFKKLEKAPELREPIEDTKLIDKNKGLVGILLSAILPPALLETEVTAIIQPFRMQSFYRTPGFDKVFPMFEDIKDMGVSFSMPAERMLAGKVASAGSWILKQVYGYDLTIEKPLLLTVDDQKTGLTRKYKLDLQANFVDVVVKGKPKKITEEDVQVLRQNIFDPDLWMRYLPPKNYEFHGFVMFRLVDVTNQELISDLKYDLLEKDAISSPDKFDRIQHNLRSIFKMPDLQLSIVIFNASQNSVQAYGYNFWDKKHDDDLIDCSEWETSAFAAVHESKSPLLIEDLKEYPNKTSVEKRLLKDGVRSIAIAPLMIEDEMLGMITLTTPNEGDMNALNAAKLGQLIPVFNVAIKRVTEENINKVEAVIKEQATAIHPTVEWKFVEAATKLIENKRVDEHATMDPIVFSDVYPIYGQSDIRNSSKKRNEAIQSDLIEHMTLVKKVLNTVMESRPLPILDEMKYRVEEEIKLLKKGLSSGDETSLLEFVKTEIDPLLKHFREAYPEYKKPIDDYFGKLEPRLGVIYKKRKAFEDSLTDINNMVSNYLEESQVIAQKMFPHYFEKYKTDGVEYNIYLGSSLVQSMEFDEVYLKNLRLWQLIKMAEIGRKVENLKPSLAMSLDITQLILVHNVPISIRFRYDEKKFDVDGAYNIRYEIVKKRIDKAYIKGTTERLTQPGKIAIVYAQPKEAVEYEKYIRYMQAKGYLTDKVEYLELEELQGAQGLRALRVEIDLKSKVEDFGNEVIENVVKSLAEN